MKCACAYALFHGVLTYNNRNVSNVSSVVGEVQLGEFDGGAKPKERKHEWLRGTYHDDTTFNVDLTACQFYKRLDSLYTGDPCTGPLFANTMGLSFGSTPVIPCQGARTAVVLENLKEEPALQSTAEALVCMYRTLEME